MFRRYSNGMRLLFSGFIVLAHIAFGNAAQAALADSPAACAMWLAAHADASGHKHYRDCVIVVAGTYIDAEENTIPFDKVLLADDVAQHRIGTDPVFAPGNRAKLVAKDTHSVIAAIRNRRWTVDGDTAWILYDGYLKKDPDKIGFYVAERITLKKGLIREILVADITVPK
jgi:hypothetical protein